MISTRNLEALPSISELRRIMQSLAMLDAIIEDKWEYRYFSFNASWSKMEEMGSMRNGSGDDLFAVFCEAGCFLRGFDHESAMSPWHQKPPKIWLGILEDVPVEFSNLLVEPAFHMEDTTYCIWRRVNEPQWSRGTIQFAEGSDPDGSEWMLSMFDGSTETYVAYALEYFEVVVSSAAVDAVFRHEPLSSQLLKMFPSSRNLSDLLAEAKEIGYGVRI